jgi:transposase
MTLADIEKNAVLSRVLEYNCELETAAESLGVTKRTLYRMLKRWNLPTPSGGNPHVVKWSEHQRRRELIQRALTSIQKGESE